MPADTPVTTPELLTVATAVLDEVHTILPAVPSVKSIVEPTHTVEGPVIGFAVGGAGSDNVISKVAPEHPDSVATIFVYIPASNPAIII